MSQAGAREEGPTPDAGNHWRFVQGRGAVWHTLLKGLTDLCVTYRP